MSIFGTILDSEKIFCIPLVNRPGNGVLRDQFFKISAKKCVKKDTLFQNFTRKRLNPGHPLYSIPD